MITFHTTKKTILLTYQPERDSNFWAIKRLEDFENVTFNRTYTFTKNDLILNDKDISDLEHDEPLEFIFADRDGDYFKIKNHILSINFSIYIHENVQLYQKYFVSIRNISIFRKIDKIISEDIYIGGDKENFICEKEFIQLINNFPTQYEIQKYIHSRLGAVLVNYFDTSKDTDRIYNNYMNKKVSKHGINLRSEFKDIELIKFSSILDKLKNMLKDEISYNEKEWQIEIAEIILFLNPKYIHAFTESPLIDSLKNKKRKVDFLLVDSGGSIDIAEIKRPMGKAIITHGEYRDNHIPLRELTGTVMQVEKYIFHLNRSGKKGETILTNQYKKDLPENFQIKITNPSGIIIMGRDNTLTAHQRNDFEVIKRKYRNIIDIVTYDELIRRLEFTINQLKIA